VQHFAVGALFVRAAPELYREQVGGGAAEAESAVEEEVASQFLRWL